MSLPRDLITLLDYARGVAKRLGHGCIDPIHLAGALKKTEKEMFLAEFGDEAGQVLETHLDGLDKSHGEVATSDEVERILKEAAQSDNHLKTVFIELKRALPGLVSAASVTNLSSVDSAGKANEDTRTPHDIHSVVIPTNLDKFVELVEPDPKIIARETVIKSLIGSLGQKKPGTPCVVGEAGSGRSKMATALATRLLDPQYSGPLSGRRVVRLKAEAIIANERAMSLRKVIMGLDSQLILFLDDFDVLVGLGASSVDFDMLGVVRGAIGDGMRSTILAVASKYFSKLEMHNPELAEQLEKLEVPALTPEELRIVGNTKVAQLEAFHGVEISGLVLEAAMQPADNSDFRSHPGLMIERLDTASVRAGLNDNKHVLVKDIASVDSASLPVVFDAEQVRGSLKNKVVGQDHVLDMIVARLSITRAKIDLQPTRPDGVFLFVGPTGVGKTALANALSDSVFGGRDASIRLDMSEYAHDWALSRLIGPQPGFVGYTEPENWLTTRVIENPQSLILLDEIEKAHPTVWNTFLQVFDAGRLTDARGSVAIFSDCIIVMTSNLGSEAFRSNPIGFGSGESLEDLQSTRALSAVKEAMPPELVNRIDEISVFNPLSREAINRIAVNEIENLFERLSAKDYILSASPEAIQLIGDNGYDPAYGARHLQRNIERYLLQPLAQCSPSKLEAVVRDGTVCWVKVD